jgi:hypothetical protein
MYWYLIIIYILRVTGFSDAESTFIVAVIETTQRKVGWAIKPRFSIGLHKKDLLILEKIKNFFEVGEIYRVSYLRS